MTNYIKNQPWKKAAGIFVLFLMALTTSVLAAEAGADSGVEKETMWTLIKKGGPIMIPLGIASIIALALALERFISLNRDRVLPNGFLKGLGEAWAREAASRGLSVVLVARRADALREVATAIAADHGVATRTVQADVGADDLVETLARATADLHAVGRSA